MLMQCEDGSSCVNIWKQFLWKQAEEKKISWTAQITYNSAIQVVNSDQIKYLPPKLNWNSGFYSSQYMVESSKCGSKLKYLPAACHPLPSIFMTQSNLKRAQADICVGNEKKKRHKYLRPLLLRGGFKRRTERVRQTLQRNSSGAKAYPRPQSQ